MAMPTPPASEHQPSDPADTQAATPAETHQTPPASRQGSLAVTPEAQASFDMTPSTPPTATEPQPSPAQTAGTTSSIQLLQLRNQLQRMEARQLQFIEETKVFQNSLIQFLCFQFPNTATFFSTAPPPPAAFATNPSAEAGQTEQLHFSEEDIFDWQTPHEHLPEVPANILECSNARKRKAPAARVITEDLPTTSITAEAEETPANQTVKRRIRYNIITTESDTDSSESPTF
ncbi:hypothetical protein V6N12_050862 [Hibiscus sabdariffa]|uniref:Uncharacterized protein n=1 Tax=Hibiscus sabdariffa TaxID=183260 RepID=A0ABR2GDN8_9ROSI